MNQDENTNQDETSFLDSEEPVEKYQDEEDADYLSEDNSENNVDEYQDEEDADYLSDDDSQDKPSDKYIGDEDDGTCAASRMDRSCVVGAFADQSSTKHLQEKRCREAWCKKNKG